MAATSATLVSSDLSSAASWDRSRSCWRQDLLDGSPALRHDKERGPGWQQRQQHWSAAAFRQPLVGIAVDPAGGKIYWTDFGNDTIKSADLDGSNVSNTGQQRPCQSPFGIAVDPAGGKIYWTDFGNDTIKSADLDGSNVSNTGQQRPCQPTYGIAVDPAGGKIYWTDSGNDTIKSADLDGSSVETLISSGLDSLAGIAIPALTNVPRVSVASYDGRLRAARLGRHRGRDRLSVPLQAEFGEPIGATP